jgi:hypothetical protein
MSKRREEGHDQTAQCALKIFPHPVHDNSEIPESGGMDESIHVSRHAGYFEFRRQTG